MIELKNDQLVFSFPEIHPDAVLRVNFHRTLRIPDDGRTYPLPPSRGRFPLRHVDDFADRLSPEWVRRGGVMFPMYQAEAMWINFGSMSGYPFAIKVAAGKINAVTGKPWDDGLSRDPQNYMVTPGQPWLDGYVVTKGTIRQFVAMPLGAGYSAEEQVTGKAEFGGVQIQAFPLRADLWREILERLRREKAWNGFTERAAAPACAPMAGGGMGLGMGGSMRQEIYQDFRPLSDWDTTVGSRCFVHLVNSMLWRQVTGAEPPTVPPTAKEYTSAGFPWFDYYSERPAVEGSSILAKLKTVVGLAKEKGEVALPENESVAPAHVVPLGERRAPDQVREGVF